MARLQQSPGLGAIVENNADFPHSVLPGVWDNFRSPTFHMWKSERPGHQNVTVFGDKTFKEVSKLK